jgi:hypothetical protein
MTKTAIGPFPVSDVPGIQDILNELKVPYEIRRDEELLDRQEEKFRGPEGSIRPAIFGTERYLPAFVFFEIDESDIPKIGNRLELFGIVLSNLPN